MIRLQLFVSFIFLALYSIFKPKQASMFLRDHLYIEKLRNVHYAHRRIFGATNHGEPCDCAYCIVVDEQRKQLMEEQ